MTKPDGSRQSDDDWNSPEKHELLRKLKKELSNNPQFVELVKDGRENEARRRADLASVASGTTRKWEVSKAAALQNLRKLIFKKTGNKRTAVMHAGSIHIAACNYEQHSRGVVTKLTKINNCEIRSAQPKKTPVKSLKTLRRNSRSSSHIWAKSWAALSTAALEALVLGNPGIGVPMFGRTPSPTEITPLLSGAIAFAGRTTAQTLGKRDELIIAILIAYRLATGKNPAFSKSPENRTVKFLIEVEKAYESFLPSGFNIPWKSHSQLDRLKRRSLNTID
jgi:hypothetical protein